MGAERGCGKVVDISCFTTVGTKDKGVEATALPPDIE